MDGLKPLRGCYWFDHEVSSQLSDFSLSPMTIFRASHRHAGVRYVQLRRRKHSCNFSARSQATNCTYLAKLLTIPIGRLRLTALLFDRSPSDAALPHAFLCGYFWNRTYSTRHVGNEIWCV